MASEAVTKASTRDRSTFRTANTVRKGERHKIRKFSSDDLSSFYDEASALKTVSRLPPKS
ncbi:hypothetical protein PENFLA_c067G02527 [Penicillium flavigenum]|uniref:Uncharacterized protein n=1 Tax=Penicillium flavigenum TaxID=254877 RepID=A0A1V6SDT7_9EURO|nr:hypothetical protein PENFLA_c067G02527 [Penicillium flavigenum]